MNDPLSLSRGAALVAAAALMFSTSALLAQDAAKKSEVVDAGGYRVSAPPGGGWKTIRDESTNQVTFTKYKEGLLTQLAGQERGTVISVAHIMLTPGEWRMSEEEAADALFTGLSEPGIRDLNAPETLNERGETVRNDKRLRFITLEKDFLAERGGSGQKGDEAMFLFFPPDFRKSHSVFYFDYFFVRPRGGVKLYKGADLETLFAVIDSLEIDFFKTEPGPEGDLLKAAAAGDVDGVREAIARGASVDARAPRWTALSAAAFYGRREVVDLLLEHGAGIDRVDGAGGNSPLHGAIVGEEPEIALRLIEGGSAVDLRNKAGLTALMMATAIGHSGLVSTLIEKGGAVDAKTENGETALMYASEAGSLEIVQILKAKGADVNAQTNGGRTPLMYAVGRKRAGIVGWLLENGADARIQTKSGRAALWGAVESEDLESAKLLIAAGADVNAKTDTGATALMLAAEYGLTEFARLLLEKGADINARTDKKVTALKMAKWKKSAEIVEMLKAAGAKG
jgi:ankyrin repeat protein